MPSDDRFIPYGLHEIDDRDVAAVTAALRSDWLTQGPRVEEFEAALAEYCGTRFAVATSSGTAALHLGMLALGLASDDDPRSVDSRTRDGSAGTREVLTTPISFVAAANAVLHCGALPRFLDVERDTVNLAIAELERAARRSEQAVGVVPVDFAGHPCALERIGELAAEAGWFVLEDACHALGARWRDSAGVWRRVGECRFVHACVFSFHPVKHITTAEGGALLTNDPDVNRRCRQLRENGLERGVSDTEPWRYAVNAPGFNFRMSELQAALGLSQLARLDERIARRRELAAAYTERLANVEGVRVPQARDDVEHAYHLYVIRVRNRSAVFRALREAGIGVQVHYVPIHRQPLYEKRSSSPALPEAERYYEEALTLPLYPGLSERDLERVVEQVRRAVSAPDRCA